MDGPFRCYRVAARCTVAAFRGKKPTAGFPFEKDPLNRAFLLTWSLLVPSLAFAGPKLGLHDDEPSSPRVLSKNLAQGLDDDAAVLRAVLWAFEPAPPEIRVIAVEDLGLLGDARVLNPLAQLVSDPNPLVQQAAVRAISVIRHPRAEEILANVVRHPTLPEKLKLQALGTLLFQNTRSSLLFLHMVARNAQYSVNLQNAARRVLQDTTPEAMGRR